MYITMQQWEKIRRNFSEREKAQLNSAKQGETLCPQGIFITEDKLSNKLRSKLSKCVKGTR